MVLVKMSRFLLTLLVGLSDTLDMSSNARRCQLAVQAVTKRKVSAQYQRVQTYPMHV